MCFNQKINWSTVTDDGSANDKEKETSPEHKMVQVLESPSHYVIHHENSGPTAIYKSW